MRIHALNLGSELEVQAISRPHDADLTYHAVCSEVVDPTARIAVIDLAGTTLDCIFGESRRVELAATFPLGVLALARQSRAFDMETRVERLVMSHTGQLLEQIRRREPDVVVLTSGTAQTLLRVARALGCVGPVVGCLSTATVVALASRLAKMNPSETPVIGVPAARSETIAVGAVVLATVATRLGVPFVRIGQAP